MPHDARNKGTREVQQEAAERVITDAADPSDVPGMLEGEPKTPRLSEQALADAIDRLGRRKGGVDEPTA